MADITHLFFKQKFSRCYLNSTINSSHEIENRDAQALFTLLRMRGERMLESTSDFR